MPLSIALFGPFSIHIYGVMIAAGVCTFLIAFAADPVRKKLISMDDIWTTVTVAIVSGIIGGKILYLAEYIGNEAHLSNYCFLWDTGFSLLGTFVAVPVVVGWYLYSKKLSVMKIFDRCALYLPLTVGISRLGCYFAGCCYGIPTDSWLGVMYTDPESLAPLFESLHPTQLYSAGLEFLIFIYLYTFAQKKFTKPGQLFGEYLTLLSAERFTVDLLRGDRTFIGSTHLSFSQYAALGVAVIGCVIFILATYTHLFDQPTKKVSA